MADSELSGGSAELPLALRPAPSSSDADESLMTQLQRISAQFGQFRHMDEDKLAEMAAAQQAGLADAEEAQDDDEEAGDDAKKRADELREAKADMFKHINDAQQEILYTIDFLGLLLSKDNPRGSNYMSPTLKQSGVPEGSFSYDKWPVKQLDERQKKQQDLVAKGWTMEGLGASADSLLQAATKLEKEVRKETQYWGQILSVKKRGWSLRRVPRESGTLGVQFGFLEASDRFQARGFAPLRAKEDGNIILDQALVQKPKTIRVRIVECGKTVGTSEQNNLVFAQQSDLEIEDLIRRARDSLFEQELFHEMTMETRQLLSYKTQFRDHVIIIPANPEYEASEPGQKREIHVDLIGVEDAEELLSRRPEDGLANDVALTLRLLLTYIHSQRLRKRTQQPLPMTDRPRPEPQLPIIRIMLNFIYHYNTATALRSHLSSIQHVLARAGISLNINLESAYANLSEAINTVHSDRSRLPQLDALMTVLSRPLHTTATFSLPSTLDEAAALRQELTVTLRTPIAPHIQGTDISLTIPPALAGILYRDNRQAQKRILSFDALDALQEYIDHAMSMDLSLNLAMRDRSNLQARNAKNRLPELSYFVRRGENKEAVMLQLATHISGKEGCLKVRWYALDAQLGGDEAVWRKDDGESRSFKEVVGAFLNVSLPS
ncbi:rna polymerase ii mediator complex component [Diplodia corticola]|uniref:Mediator of RNA polymerase II transcription subunit 17 n=1 Tax=Diplodia corticola TaxID=236234 RepID=A0A1J9REB2_9PEZI|nr:rna polymerase ii mediator complex component [Diplodia corticola]OJD39854.1 rna polymerase ii mediator complex component [Diplodia corticola]